MDSQQPSENKYQIGFIASPRASKRTGGISHKRGKHQFTGHTAVYIKIDNEEIARGLVPDSNLNKNLIKGLIRLVKAVFLGKTVKGHWQDDKALLTDKTSKFFTIDVTKEDAEAFNKYFNNVVVSQIKDYTLEPHKRDSGGFYDTNCVHAALLAIANFLAETQNEEGSIQFYEIASNLRSTMQGHLMQALDEQNEQ